MKKWIALAALAGLAPTGGAAYQPRESLAGGSSYFSQCVSGAKKDESVCLGYFMGISDAPVTNSEKSREEAFYCLPVGRTYEQNRDVFHKYLLDNPQIRNLPTHHQFMLAMNVSFPCKNSPKLSVDPETGGVYFSVTKPDEGKKN